MTGTVIDLFVLSQIIVPSVGLGLIALQKWSRDDARRFYAQLAEERAVNLQRLNAMIARDA